MADHPYDLKFKAIHNNLVDSKVEGYPTPATFKLHKMRQGKGAGMLTPEEIELLRQSKKEIAEIIKNVREARYSSTCLSTYVGARNKAN